MRYGNKTRLPEQVSDWLPNSFNPMRFSPSIWLDAGDATTFTYSSGTVVSQWDDKSGNGFHVSQATGAAQPSRNGTLNGISTVVFDGGDFLAYTGSTISVSTMTCFLVASESSSVNNAGFYSFHSGTGNDFDRQDSMSFGAGASPTDSGLARFVNAASGQANSQGTKPTAARINELILESNGELTGFKNGDSFENVVLRAGTFTTATGGFVVGARFLSGAIAATNRLNGQVAEIIIYPTVLTFKERTLVRNYLNQKWAQF
jgi:hypothetical protein